MRGIIAILVPCLPLLGQHHVDLAWTASVTAGVTTYKVYRGGQTGGPYSLITSVNATSTSDTAVTQGSTYCYVVTAVAAGGESPYSNEACGTVPGTVTPPPGGSPAPCPKTVFPSTFLRQPAGSSDTALPLDSISCLYAWYPDDLKKFTFGVLVDQEYMTMTTPPTYADLTATGRIVWLHVARGASGGYAQPHSAGATAWYGPANYFQNMKPTGSCPGNASVLPWVEIGSGGVYDCTAGQWVKR